MMPLSTMPIVVQKYGGTSVADVTRIRQVAGRIMRTKAAGYDVAVVVSAMGDTTDELLAMARQVSTNPDRRELDMLLSAGERISMALLTMAIKELGGDAISFTGSQSGIITNDRHVDARIVEVRPYRVQDELARGRVVVIAGYQGVSYRREVTTLGRGGSDTTAVAMAAALGAEWCEICSDVDGVYTADPRVVTAARRVDALTYEETQELAEAGAKVLNAQAVEFAKEKGIAIWARATASPLPALPGTDPTSDGTVVRRHAPRMPGTVAGVASERDILVLQARGDATRLVALLDACAVSGKQLHVASLGGNADGTTLVISRENLHNEDRLRRDLSVGFGDDARLVDGLGAVSVVGAGINATYENVRKGSACLTDRRIPTFGLATSSFRATWLVKRDQIDDAARALHATFIEKAD
ncbi:MAG TPA: aspartate kinase [Vicinamibacterales bacterium]|jgi:aspartate kinase|nr:aspartate kinase [Vicinamibacterales bacterium]